LPLIQLPSGNVRFDAQAISYQPSSKKRNKNNSIKWVSMAIRINRHPETPFFGGRPRTSQTLVRGLYAKILTHETDRRHDNIFATPTDGVEEELRYFAYSRIQV
jgi:hypothetical protein